MFKKKNQRPDEPHKLTGTFITQPISQANARDEKTNTALPDDENVAENRDWVNYNKK